MKKITLISFMILVFFSYLYLSTLEERIKNISKSEMQSTVEFLSHDLLEGRKPGTRGGNLSERYIMSLFKFLDLKPGIDNAFLQRFELKGFDSKEMDVVINNIPLAFQEEIVGTYPRELSEFKFEGDLVFIGFGIKADLWNWDDYKDVDVRDKIVVTRVNDPGMFNPQIFEGRTLTYFGRWIYHIEEAARQGAAGILLIHTDQSAGYSWEVVQNSWSGEELYLKSDLENRLKFRAWIREKSLKKILDLKNIKLQELYDSSLKSDFKPINLSIKIKVKGKNSFRTVSNCNVVGEIPGKSAERIVFSAHIDHFGIDKDKKGDNIYNGAIDNGTAVASMLLTAKILKEFQKDLYYTVTFLACNSEEAGMLGSKFYIQNADREKIIANINFESTPVWERSKSIMGIGARFSTFEDILKILAQNEGIKYRQFSMSNQGFFYRSDQFSFARYDIPAIWISAGEDDESGENKYTRFWKTNYHTVKDEFDPRWKLEGMKQTIKFALLLIDYLNKHKMVPRWKGRLTFPRDGVKKRQ